jgi:hypothetical protein
MRPSDSIFEFSTGATPSSKPSKWKLVSELSPGFLLLVPSMYWSVRFQQLGEFKAQTGHCLVPREYTANPKPGRRVNLSAAQELHIVSGRKAKSHDRGVFLALDGRWYWFQIGDNCCFLEQTISKQLCECYVQPMQVIVACIHGRKTKSHLIGGLGCLCQIVVLLFGLLRRCNRWRSSVESVKSNRYSERPLPLNDIKKTEKQVAITNMVNSSTHQL